MAGGNPIDDYYQRNAPDVGEYPALAGQYSSGPSEAEMRRLRRRQRLMTMQPRRRQQAVAEVEALRAGGVPPEPPAEEAPPVTFNSAQEVWDHLRELDAARSAQESQLEETKKYLDSLKITPKNADRLKAAYKAYDAEKSKHAKFSESIDDLAHRMREEQSAARKAADAKAADAPWWRAPVAALGYTANIPLAALGELGDLVGGLFDSEQDANARERINESVAKRAYNPGEGTVGNILNYIREKGQQTSGAVGTVYAEGRKNFDPTSGTAVDPAVAIANLTNAFTGAKPYMKDKDLAEGGYVSSYDVDRFVGKTVEELAVDPTSYMGLGIYSKALRIGGAAAGLKGIEELGAKALLLKEGSATRGALEATARAEAMRLNPAIRGTLTAEQIADYVAGKPLGNVLKPTDHAALSATLETNRTALTQLAETNAGQYLKAVRTSLRPYEADKGIAASLRGAESADELLGSAGAKSPLVAETVRGQAELAQRVSSWKSVFAAMDAIEKQFPKVAAVGEWVRDSLIQRVPFAGPVARAWGASRGQGAAQTSELFVALGQYKEELRQTLKPLKKWEQDEVVAAGRQLVELPSNPPLIAPRHLQAAKDVADIFHDATEYVKDFERAFGVDAAELTDNVLDGWWSHSYSDEMRRFVADNPVVREKLGASLDEASRTAWRIPEDMSRTLRGMSFEQVEDFIRQKGGIPAGVKILERNPEAVLNKRYAFAGKRIERARQIDAVVKEFGVTTKPAGASKTAYELMEQGGALMPTNPQAVADLKNTYILESDLKKYAELAPGFAGHNTAESIHASATMLGKAFNLAALHVRRSFLGTWASTAKDIIGNWLWLAVASDKPGMMAKAVTDFARGKADEAVVTLLEREGVLQSIADEPAITGAARASEFVKSRPGTLALGTSLVGKGLEGVGLRKFGSVVDKVGEAIGKPANTMLRLRAHMDNAARYALYIERRARGFSHKDAVSEVYKFLGNFRDVATGKLEQKQLRAFFTFWTWNRKALGFAMRGAMDYPLRSKLMFLAAAGNAQEKGDVSRWARGRAGWIIGKDAQGNPETINLGPVTYMDPAWKLLNMQSLEEASRGNIGRAGSALLNDALSSSLPMIAKPIELAMDTDTFTGDRITGAVRKEGRFADQAPAILAWIPGVREALDVRPVVETDADGNERILHYRMNPFAKWFIGLTAPGEQTLAWQASGIGDERRSLVKAGIRAATGIPFYSMPELAPDKQKVLALRNLDEKLRISVEQDEDTPFKVSLGRLVVDKTTQNGARVQRRFESLKAEDAQREVKRTDAEMMREAIASLDERWLAQYDLDRRLDRAVDRIREGLDEMEYTDKKLRVTSAFKSAMANESRIDRIRQLADEDYGALKRRIREKESLEKKILEMRGE